MTRRQYHDGDVRRVDSALRDLRIALENLKKAGARKTAARVRLAISSAKGARRNIINLRAKAGSRRQAESLLRGCGIKRNARAA